VPVPPQAIPATQLREFGLERGPVTTDLTRDQSNGRNNANCDEGGDQDVLDDVLARIFLVEVVKELNHLCPSFLGTVPCCAVLLLPFNF